MKTIKFNNTEYNLVFTAIENSTKLRITILKENHTIPEIADAVKDITTISILEDDEVVAQYNQYTDLVTLQSFSDYPINGEETDSVILIEMVNGDLQEQINALTGKITSLEESQVTQDGAIEDLATAVDELASMEE